ncbi:polysaccharide deacetylase family protein [Hymenobacter sp. BT770]|nr:polysaccharide deacetylase family protein [Hymenobacter sp. BT770]MCC3155278.1 polysaccharide deacetylase family protein [Hymenobacter sp. BT770]
MYHSIKNTDYDPWQLAVSPLHFEQHLQVLKQSGRVVPYNTLIEQLKSKNVKRGSIVLTFDDGYRDNYTLAKPLLEHYGIPATFFIPTDKLGSEQEFWWDELERIIIHTIKLPRLLSIRLAGELLEYDLQEEEELTPTIRHQHQSWAASSTAPTRRTALFMLLWKALKYAPHEEIKSTINSLNLWSLSPAEKARQEYTTITVPGMLQLASNGLFQIGGHTATHPSLPSLPIEEQIMEVIQGKQTLERELKTVIEHFAYPYGDFSPDTKYIVSNSGFQSGVSTRHQTVNNNSDLFELGRFQVKDWQGAIFKKTIKNWFRYY